MCLNPYTLTIMCLSFSISLGFQFIIDEQTRLSDSSLCASRGENFQVNFSPFAIMKFHVPVFELAE